MARLALMVLAVALFLGCGGGDPPLTQEERAALKALTEARQMAKDHVDKMKAENDAKERLLALMEAAEKLGEPDKTKAAQALNGIWEGKLFADAPLDRDLDAVVTWWDARQAK